MLHERYQEEWKKQQAIIATLNHKTNEYNGIYDRYEYPVLTKEHIPLFWRYDLNVKANPFFMERLGVNAVMNAGAIYLNGKYLLVARVEGNDRKSFFAVAESDTGVDGFRFWDYPVQLEDTCLEETNVYDMRLTQHEDGYIYGVFCSESKDRTNDELSAAVAAAGIVRTKDLITWERLDNLITKNSPQQRNVVLHPEFVNGKYAFYTRPMDGFIETGSKGGIGFGLCEDIEHPVIEEEVIVSERKYHTITEAKNGAGAVPIKTSRGWIHIAHGVRNTAAGLRYVLYGFATDLNDPSKVIAEPSGLFLAPHKTERIGDVSNVVFSNGIIVNEQSEVYIYYASSDTRMHVVTTTIDHLIDYVFNTPKDPLRSVDCVKQRCEMISENLNLLSFEKKVKLYSNQRLENWQNSVEISDSSGNTKYTAEGFASGEEHSIELYNQQKIKIGQIKEHLYTLLPVFEIEYKGNKLGEIEKEYSLYEPKYKISFGEYQLKGDLLSWNFVLEDQERNNIHVIKEALEIDDGFELIMDEELNEEVGVLLILALDAAMIKETEENLIAQS